MDPVPDTRHSCLLTSPSLPSMTSSSVKYPQNSSQIAPFSRAHRACRSPLQTDRQPIQLNPSIRCGPDGPDCALFHDKLSLMWGEFEDNVDELTMTMVANQVEFNEINGNSNDQLALLTTAKAKLGCCSQEHGQIWLQIVRM